MLQFKRSGSLVGWTGQGPPPVPSKPELIKNLNTKKRQDELEQRHQELLARQRQLQVTRPPVTSQSSGVSGQFLPMDPCTNDTAKASKEQ